MEDYKKKYEEALENFKKIEAANKDNKELVNFIEYKYPELKESEDEKVSKWLIRTLKALNTAGINIEGAYEMMLPSIAWLEKKCEQKPTDKVEPKSGIEKGKWYVCNTPRYRDFVVGKAYYCPKNGMLKPNENEMARYVARHCFHIWTIKDAKDGDVLVTKDIVFIFKHMDKTGLSLCKSYCEVVGNSKLGLGFDFSISGVHPATKEQRDLLFSKMKEAGYEWDAEKKELRKIEQKPTWSEDDEKFFKTALWHISHSISNGKSTDIHCDTTDWLKSLKERYTWKPSESDILLLERIANGKSNPQDFQASLYGLIGRLKKLREE